MVVVNHRLTLADREDQRLARLPESFQVDDKLDALKNLHAI